MCDLAECSICTQPTATAIFSSLFCRFLCWETLLCLNHPKGSVMGTSVVTALLSSFFSVRRPSVTSLTFLCGHFIPVGTVRIFDLYEVQSFIFELDYNFPDGNFTSIISG